MHSKQLKKTVTIAITTIFQNGGEATRAIEIAKIIKKYQPDTCRLKIIFISRGSQFEQAVLSLGFDIYHAKPRLKGVNYQEDFHSRFGELIGLKGLALEILQGEIEACKTIKPDLLICGFWPVGNIARRMAIPSVKIITFLPLPLKEAFLKESHTFPDELLLSRLPRRLQRRLFKLIPLRIAKRNPALRHTIIRQAAETAGWQGRPLVNIFEMLESDVYLINDIPDFYDTQLYGDNCIFTGAIFAKSNGQEITDKNIQSVLSPSNRRKKIFCSFGSSGSPEHLFEAIKAFNTKKGLDYSGIILSPPAVCDISDARLLLKNRNFHITDQFVPAKTINEKVDLVICHGGQGTLQTAVSSGVPVIGTASQPEQKTNLENLENFGGAARIPSWNWRSQTIARKVDIIFRNYSCYKQKAEDLKTLYSETQAEKIISETVWGMLNQPETRVMVNTG